VAYQTQTGNGGCPPDHPVVLPLLFYEVLYWTIDIDQSAGGDFVFAQGDTTSYGFHGDFMNGWKQDVLENAVESCLSLADNPYGTVSTCAALAASDDVNYPRICPEQPSFVSEPVGGALDHLPGCNPVTSGPESQPQVVCQVGSMTPASNSSNPASSSSSSTTVYFANNSESPASSTIYPSFTTSTFSFNGSFPFLTSSSFPSSMTLSIAFFPNSTVATNVPGAFFPNSTASSSTTTTTPTSGPQITTFVTITNAMTLNTTLTIPFPYFPNGTVPTTSVSTNSTATFPFLFHTTSTFS
jgi:hypothetical protein